MKRRLILGTLLTLALTSTIAYAATPSIPTATDLFTSSGLNQQSIVDQFPISNYAFDATDWTAKLNPIYWIANGLFFIAIFLLRMAITVMNFGFNPPQMASLVSTILGIMKNAVPISMNFLGLVGLALVIMVVWDFGKGRLNVALARIIKVVLVISLIFLYSKITVDQVTKITQAVDGISSSFADVLLSIPVGTDSTNSKPTVNVPKKDTNLSGLALATKDLDDQVWGGLAIYPFVMGEMGGNLQVKDSDLSTAREAPDNSLLVPSNKPYWYQALLQLPLDDSKRNDMRSALIKEGAYPGAVDAFSWSNRFLIGIVTFLASFGPILFFVMFGGISFLLRLSFLFSLLVAIGVLILEMVPITRTNRYFMWWFKFTSGTLVGSVALSTYVGAVAFVIKILETEISFGSIGAIFTIVLNGAWYVAAIWIFFKLVKKFNPITTWNQFIEKKMPNQMRFQPHKGSEAASFGVTRNAGGKGGKSILSPNLLRGLNKKKQGVSDSQSPKRIRNQRSDGSDLLGGNGNGNPISPSGGGSGGGNATTASVTSSASSQSKGPLTAEMLQRKYNRNSTVLQPSVPVPPLSRIARIDQKAETKWNQTKTDAKAAYATTKQAIQQTPARLKSLPSQMSTSAKNALRQLPSQLGRGAVNAARAMNPRDMIAYAKRSWQEAKAYEKDQNKLRHSLHPDDDETNRPSTLLGKVIADFNQIKNTPDAHAFTRYALGVTENLTKGAAKALGRTAMRAGSAAARTTYNTGLKTAGIAGSAAWVGMRKGQRFAEQKSLEVAVQSQVKLHELSRNHQINKEAKAFIKGMDEWEMTAFHGRAHVSTVEPGGQTRHEGANQMTQTDADVSFEPKQLKPNLRIETPSISDPGPKPLPAPTAANPIAQASYKVNRPVLKRSEKPDAKATKNPKPVTSSVPKVRMQKPTDSNSSAPAETQKASVGTTKEIKPQANGNPKPKRSKPTIVRKKSLTEDLNVDLHIEDEPELSL